MQKIGREHHSWRAQGCNQCCQIWCSRRRNQSWWLQIHLRPSLRFSSWLQGQIWRGYLILPNVYSHFFYWIMKSNLYTYLFLVVFRYQHLILACASFCLSIISSMLFLTPLVSLNELSYSFHWSLIRKLIDLYTLRAIRFLCFRTCTSFLSESRLPIVILVEEHFPATCLSKISVPREGSPRGEESRLRRECFSACQLVVNAHAIVNRTVYCPAAR